MIVLHELLSARERGLRAGSLVDADQLDLSRRRGVRGRRWPRSIRAWAPWIVSWPNEEATGPVSGVRMPRVIVFPVVALVFEVLEPAAPVVLDDELQAAVTPDTRMVTTAAASNLLLVGIIIKTFR